MAHYDLEEQEQIDSIKAWWNAYGNLVTSLLLAVTVAVVGWRGWNWYQDGESGKAAAVFDALEHAVDARDAQKIKSLAGELTEKYGRSSYAGMGALLAARQSFDSGDLKTARAQLSWAADNAKDEVRDVARLRLAAVLLDEKAYDEALKQLDGGHAAAFDARFLEAKGDVLAAQGKRNDARDAYRTALEKMGEPANAASRELLQQKLDSMGEAA
ncbi:MAG: tetratricopeptide repeat protein [Azonexaceae bacterium]|nr:tetratricopeptide repeat protein [Azonexaceae bacterium]